MLKNQVDALADKLFAAVDDVLNLQTDEGMDVYRALQAALNRFQHDRRSDRCTQTPDFWQDDNGGEKI